MAVLAAYKLKKYIFFKLSQTLTSEFKNKKQKQKFNEKLNEMSIE